MKPHTVSNPSLGLNQGSWICDMATLPTASLGSPSIGLIHAKRLHFQHHKSKHKNWPEHQVHYYLLES